MFFTKITHAGEGTDLGKSATFDGDILNLKG